MIRQTPMDIWVIPLIFAAIGTVVFFLIAWGIYELARWLIRGPRPSYYHCPNGEACPCIDHQNRLRRETESANLALGIATGVAVGSAINSVNQ